jgi:nucleotide-binding universal stress UspA family protein
MQALIWIIDETWEATVAEAAQFLPADAEITLLHVTSNEPEAFATATRHGLLGRHRAPASAPPRLREISDQAALELLTEARTRLGRDAALESRRGRIGREVVTAAERMDILILARDGDRARLGPHSLGPDTRFVIDHAPCRVLLIWPEGTPALTTLPPPPPPRSADTHS